MKWWDRLLGSPEELERLEREVERLRQRIDGPSGLESELVAARKGEQIEFRMRKAVERRAERLQTALEALIDVQPYVHANPNSPRGKEWEAKRERVLDRAAAVLDEQPGYQVKPHSHRAER